MRASGTRVNEYKEIGNRIRFYREKAGISQAALSKKLGFKSPTALFYIEQGSRRVKVFDLVQISRVVGVPLMLLISGVNDYEASTQSFSISDSQATQDELPELHDSSSTLMDIK